MERPTKVRQVKALKPESMEWLRKAHPDIALKMLRNTFHHSSLNTPNVWLSENCSGFYHAPNSTNIMFELEEDAVLFKIAFDGK